MVLMNDDLIPSIDAFDQVPLMTTSTNQHHQWLNYGAILLSLSVSLAT